MTGLPVPMLGAGRACPAVPGLWRSTDLDEVRHQGGRVFCDHRLDVRSSGQRLDTRLAHRRLGSLGIGRLSYGADVDIDPQALDGFYLLQWPCQGRETIEQGNARITSDARTGTLITPGQRFRMRHDAGTEKLFVRIDEAAVRSQMASLAPGSGRGSPVFAPRLVFDDDRLRSLARLLRWLFDEAAADAPWLRTPMLAAPAEELLLRLLLQVVPHDGSDRLGKEPAAAAPRFVRQAEAFIDAHVDEPLTAQRIAAEVGVSVRSLYAGFQRHRQTSPIAHLRDLRMQRVRRELLSPADAAQTVTTIAFRWGFGHLGQFSADYRRRYGELPSETLRRTRGR